MGTFSSREQQKDKEQIFCFDELVDLYQKLCAYGLFDQQLFNEHFSGPSDVVKKNLYELFFIDFLNSSDAAARLFAERCNIILDFESKPKNEQVGLYFDLLHERNAKVTESSILALLKDCCAYSLISSSKEQNVIVNDSDSIFSGLLQDLMTGKDIGSKEDFVDWVIETCPFLFNGFQLWLQWKFTGITGNKQQTEILALPASCNLRKMMLSNSLLWFLSSTLPTCYLTWESKYSGEGGDEVDAGFQEANQSWNLLYDSSEHGLSLNRFKNKVLSYKSPTITLIQLSDSTTLLLGIDEPWRDSTDRYGGPYCCLKEIYPTYQVLVEDSKIVYFKETSRALPTGILIGKSSSADKLKIDSGFCDAQLYRNGLYTEIPIDRIEVWGCGGVDALSYQAGIKKWELKETEKRRKVKLPGQWDTDKTILEMGGVTVNHSQRADV